jgi:hypothetical protein
MWGRVLSGKDAHSKPVLINKHNCPNLIISIQQAEAVETRLGTAKNKTPEKNDSVKQEHATHFTDTFDSTFVGCFGAIKIEDNIDYSITF